MFRLIVVWLFGTVVCSAYGEDDPFRFIPLTRPWLEVRSRERGVPQVDESTRLKMISELHLAAKDTPLTLTYGMRIDVLLVDLGDEPTIQRHLEAYAQSGRNGNSTSVLVASKQPGLVLALGPLLFIEESPEAVVSGETMTVPRSSGATILTLGLLQRCAEFPEPVKAWAGSLVSSAKPRAALRGETRVFWQQNQALLAAKNYGAVRIPDLPYELRTNAVPSQAGVPAATLPAAARPPAKRAASVPATNSAATPPKPADPAPAVAVAANPTGPLLWPWLLLAVTSLGGWLWWRTRSA